MLIASLVCIAYGIVLLLVPDTLIIMLGIGIAFGGLDRLSHLPFCIMHRTRETEYYKHKRLKRKLYWEGICFFPVQLFYQNIK